jgi:hypothetical protein
LHSKEPDRFPLNTNTALMLPGLSVDHLPWPEGEPQERQGDVPVLAATVAVLAVDDPRLVGVQPEPNLLHPRDDPAQDVLRFPMRRAVHHRVVGVALERAARGTPGPSKSRTRSA